MSDAAEHRADHEAEHRDAEHRPERLPAPFPRRADRDPGERRRPRRRAREPLDEAARAESDRASGQREREARERKHAQAEEEAALGADPADEETARDAADERSGSVGAEERTGLELRQVVRVGEVGEERDDRAEQHRVQEDDRSRRDEHPAHRPRIRTGVRRAGAPFPDQRKCTESVSPPSSSPDRPPPKRLPVGSAFNLRRSVLGAIRNLAANSTSVKHLQTQFVANCAFRLLRRGQGITREQAGVDSTRNWSTQKRTEAGSPSSDLPTDRRRSDCRSEGHQPQALRPRCNWETRGRSTARQVMLETRNTLFATFPLQRAHICVESHMLYLNEDQGFAEPGALSSTSPTDLPLPRTALRESFVLVASRARRSGNLRFADGPVQGDRTTETPQIATSGERMSDRHVVVTGAGRGIGRAIALRLAA